jgi:hypothetical protein
MPEIVARLLDILPPLKGPKNPGMASVIGFLTGGIGLGVYFRSFLDVVVPIVLYLVLTVTSAQVLDLGWIVGALVAGYYGYVRAAHSNTRLAAVGSPVTP